MIRWYTLISGIVLISCSCATGQQVPFTPEGIATLVGKNVCQLEGTFPKQLGVYIDRHKEHAVQYRERDGMIAIFLLRNPSSNCGIVDTALDLTNLIKKGESPEFKCYTDHEGGTIWGKWGRIVGLANNRRGTVRYASARLAWRVDIERKRFEPIRGKTVRCDPTGYED